jgi:hypothetical protein
MGRIVRLCLAGGVRVRNHVRFEPYRKSRPAGKGLQFIGLPIRIPGKMRLGPVSGEESEFAI